MSDNLESVMRRVQKLLAIAQDDRANPNEAAAAAGMAERIMRKYQLEESDIIIRDIKAGTDLETADCITSAKTNGTKVETVPLWASWIATLVSAFNDCGARIVRNDNSEEVVRFFGYKGDVQLAKYMLDYLVSTTLRLCNEFKTTDLYKVQGRKAVNSYRQGVSSGICASLLTLINEKQAQQQTQSTSTALVVVKQDAIVAKYGEVFSTRKSKSKVSDGAARHMGYQDGKRVDVARRGIEGSQSQGLLQ